jgi:uncharacterized phage-associated protein
MLENVKVLRKIKMQRKYMQKIYQISKIKQYLLLFKNGLVTDISRFKVVHLSWFARLQLMISEKQDVIEEI